MILRLRETPHIFISETAMIFHNTQKFVCALPEEAFSHFFIYTESSLVEQTTPFAHAIFDAQVRCISFCLKGEAP